MNFSVDLRRQIILQVVIRRLGIFDQARHLGAGLLCSGDTALQDADFFLYLSKVVVLIFDHGSELTAINRKFFKFVHACIKSLCNVFTKLNHFAVMRATRLIQKVFEVFDLPADLVERDHESLPLLPCVVDLVSKALDGQDKLIVISDCFFDIAGHAFLLNTHPTAKIMSPLEVRTSECC